MEKPIKRSDLYIFGYPRGFTELVPVAVVLKKTDTKVVYSRYLDHGRIYDGNSMVSLEEFDANYHPVNDIEYAVLKCLGYMKLYCDYDDDSEGGLIADD
jgi:hypothetical protein